MPIDRILAYARITGTLAPAGWVSSLIDPLPTDLWFLAIALWVVFIALGIYASIRGRARDDDTSFR